MQRNDVESPSSRRRSIAITDNSRLAAELEMERQQSSERGGGGEGEGEAEGAPRLEAEVAYLKQCLLLKEKKIALLEEEAQKRDERQAHEEESAKKQVYGLVSANQRLQDEVGAERERLLQQQSEYQRLLRDKEAAELSIASLNEREDRNEQMKKILKKTRADLRTLAPEKKILEEKVRLLEEKLVENEAKYGLLERTRMGQVIEKQQEYLEENSHLRETLVLKDMHVNELKEVQSNLEQALQDEFTLRKEMQRHAEIEQETARRQIKREAARFEQLAETLRQAESKSAKQTTQLLEMDERVRELMNKLSRSIAEAESLKGRVEDLQEELAVVRDHGEVVEAQRKDAQEAVRMVKQKLKLQGEEVREAREEMKFKDATLRMLQEQLRSKPNSGGSKADAAAIKSTNKKIIWLKNRIALLESELDEQRQACQAHASHSAFLSTQMSQMQREHLLKLKIKQQTIQRLREDLIAAKKAAGCGVGDEEQVPEGDKDTMDDLRSQLELLKKEYFTTLAFNIKMQSNVNVELGALYERLPRGLPVVEWPVWIDAQIERLMRDDAASLNDELRARSMSGGDLELRQRRAPSSFASSSAVSRSSRSSSNASRR